LGVKRGKENANEWSLKKESVRREAGLTGINKPVGEIAPVRARHRGSKKIVSE